MIKFPNISPIIFSIGPLDIRWYSMAYIFGAILAILYINYLLKISNLLPKNNNKKFFEDLFFYIMLGIVIGGRIGFVIFYQPLYFINNPLSIFALWEGGMSFHGGVTGSVIGAFLLSRKKDVHINFLSITDIMATAAPIGLFLGRLANFINAELYGRPTNMPWGVVFPHRNVPLHPSQLYEAFLEGIVLFIILFVLFKFKKLYKYNGMISGLFCIFYAIFRFIVEFFREPEIVLFNILTMGQLLSIVMIVLGLFIIKYSYKKNVKK